MYFNKFLYNYSIMFKQGRYEIIVWRHFLYAMKGVKPQYDHIAAKRK